MRGGAGRAGGHGLMCPEADKAEDGLHEHRHDNDCLEDPAVHGAPPARLRGSRPCPDALTGLRTYEQSRSLGILLSCPACHETRCPNCSTGAPGGSSSAPTRPGGGGRGHVWRTRHRSTEPISGHNTVSMLTGLITRPPCPGGGMTQSPGGAGVSCVPSTISTSGSAPCGLTGHGGLSAEVFPGQ